MRNHGAASYDSDQCQAQGGRAAAVVGTGRHLSVLRSSQECGHQGRCPDALTGVRGVVLGMPLAVFRLGQLERGKLMIEKSE